MYVRLKHTLSALVLEAIEHPARRRDVAWLAAFCDRLRGSRAWARDGPRDGHHHRARPAGPPPAWLLDHGLVEMHDGTPTLPDGYRSHFDYLNRQVHRAVAALRTRSPRSAPKRGGSPMPWAAALFNHGLFFECHEFLEDVWRAAPPEARGFYHGVILVAAAFYHFEKRNAHGARVKLTQALKYLAPYAPAAHGVRLDRWIRALEPWRRRVEAGDVTGVLKPSEIPRIPLARSSARRRAVATTP